MPIVIAVLLVLFPFALRGQETGCRAVMTPLAGAGSTWQRVARLTDGRPSDLDQLLRTSVGCEPGEKARGNITLRRVLPGMQLVLAGGVPDSRADGALWAGRGASAIVRSGFTADVGRFHIALVPELWAAANRPFDVVPGGDKTRSAFSSPFYFGEHSVDLPSRLGIKPLLELSLGQSAAWFDFRGVEIGASSSNLWWGPGVRDGLLFGPGAAGIPRLFVRTQRPMATPLGFFGSELFLGVLTESRWFDRTSNDDRRALSAAALTWSPTLRGELVLGIARATQRVVPRNASLASRALDVLRPMSDAQGDRMLLLFGRYTAPRAGMRAYLEVATPRPAGRLRDWLTVPGELLAYQFGAEKVIRRPAVQWLLHTEMMNLEHGIQVRERAPRDFYTGYGTPHGWTQRGQLLGTGVGPGGQMQWLSVDRITGRWHVGAYGERVRWNNEALPRQYLPTYYRHDVTLRGGIRGGVRTRIAGQPFDVALDASLGKRLNYLFQNTTFIDYRTVDVVVPQLRLTLSPRQ